jgi:DNA-damage-inducible protein J
MLYQPVRQRKWGGTTVPIAPLYWRNGRFYPFGSAAGLRQTPACITLSFRKEIAMAANALVQTRIDGAVKEEAATVLAAMGLTVSDAVRLMLTRIARDKALPFEPLVPNDTTIAAMKEAREGKGKRSATIADLMADLNADD